jgi:hypothetical protein
VLNFISHIKGRYRLRVLENRAVRKVFGPMREKAGENCMRGIIICTHHCTLLLG